MKFSRPCVENSGGIGEQGRAGVPRECPLRPGQDCSCWPAMAASAHSRSIAVSWHIVYRHIFVQILCNGLHPLT